MAPNTAQESVRKNLQTQSGLIRLDIFNIFALRWLNALYKSLKLGTSNHDILSYSLSLNRILSILRRSHELVFTLQVLYIMLLQPKEP